MGRKKRSVSVDFEEEQQRDEDHSESDHASAKAEPAQKGKKKKPKVRKNEKWTRLIHIGVTNSADISFHDVQAEIDEAVANPIPMPQRRNFSWSLLYDPEQWEKDNKGSSFDRFILSAA